MELTIEIHDILANETNVVSSSGPKVTIGRARSNDIVIENSYVSAEHAVLHIEAERILIEDRLSSNGTYVYHKHQWRQIRGMQPVSLPLQLKLSRSVNLSIMTSLESSQIASISYLEKTEAIMVLDLCDATKTAYQSNALAVHLIQRLQTICRPIIYSENVGLFKGTGDGFLCTFTSAEQAYRASRRILAALTERNRAAKNPEIHVRIALHHGKTYTIDPITRDIQGNDTNITFRLEGVRPEQFIESCNSIPARDRILCSQAFLNELCAGDSSGIVAYYYCGRAELKGIDEALPVYCLS